MVDSIDEYSQKFKQVVSNIDELNNEKKQAHRISFAKDNTYLKQIEKIEGLLQSLK